MADLPFSLVTDHNLLNTKATEKIVTIPHPIERVKLAEAGLLSTELKFVLLGVKKYLSESKYTMSLYASGDAFRL